MSNTTDTQRPSTQAERMDAAAKIIRSDLIANGTWAAVYEALRLALKRAPDARPTLAEVRSACGACKARFSPVAAAWGYARQRGSRRWLDMTAPSEPGVYGVIPDDETKGCLYAFWLTFGIEQSFFVPNQRARKAG